MASLAGWIGMVLLQSSTVPALLSSLSGSADLPPLSLTALTWAGLTLYLWNAINQRNRLYIVGNSIGLVLNTIMIGLLIL
jgi:hypothetical protein